MSAFCVAELELPKDMQELRDYELRQLTSTVQEGPSCGWYATLNAFAIQELYKQNLPLTDENIQAHVEQVGLPCIRQHEKEITQAIKSPFFEGLSIEEQDYLARFLGLTNYYLVVINLDESFWCFYEGQWCTYTLFEELLKEIKMNKMPVVHILLSIPSKRAWWYPYGVIYHAVSLSRVKRRAPKPYLLYMDSNNFPLNPWVRGIEHRQFFGGLYTASREVTRYQSAYDYMVRDHVCSFIKTIDTL